MLIIETPVFASEKRNYPNGGILPQKKIIIEGGKASRNPRKAHLKIWAT